MTSLPLPVILILAFGVLCMIVGGMGLMKRHRSDTTEAWSAAFIAVGFGIIAMTVGVATDNIGMLPVLAE